MVASEAIAYFKELIINNKNYNIEDVKRVLDQLEVVDNTATDGALTVLYSGEGKIVKQVMEAGSKVRVIDRTEDTYNSLHISFELDDNHNSSNVIKSVTCASCSKG